jgi:L-ascorbate metabolism protein UlaG (beta-lactamase superfamily)
MNAMVITNQGLDCFKIKYGDTTVAFNPASEDSDLESHRWGADIVLSSIRHPDYTGGELLTAGDKEPVVVHGPGEYEIQDISISGIQSESDYADTRHVNTIYVFRLQDMDICFIGPINDRDLPTGAQELMEGIDILFVPVTGEPTLTPADAHKLAVQIEPSIVIPTHYTDPESESVTNFVDEAGGDDVEPKDKLTLGPRDLSGRDTDIELVVPEQ